MIKTTTTSMTQLNHHYLSTSTLFLGVRSAMLNFEEIPSSLGNSSLLMESGGHKIPFSVENILGNFFSHFLKHFSEQFLSFLFYFALQILVYLSLLSTQTLHFFALFTVHHIYPTVKQSLH
jgi:hypothetical protein